MKMGAVICSRVSPLG